MSMMRRRMLMQESVRRQSIKDAMVLWYDIKRQGCTNENMADNPVLKDLSGNGHDATCYNFAWTEESGISIANYPNALVSDGVDDYAQVTGLPILTKERGYTVIAKRKYIGDTVGCLASKHMGGNPGAFKFELQYQPYVNSFNKDNNVIFETSDFSYMTKNSYNGRKINYGDRNDGDILSLFSLRGTSQYANCALYSFLLFDRDLTADEIEWVKTNLIEGD